MERVKRNETKSVRKEVMKCPGRGDEVRQRARTVKTEEKVAKWKKIRIFQINTFLSLG